MIWKIGSKPDVLAAKGHEKTINSMMAFAYLRGWENAIKSSSGSSNVMFFGYR